MLKALVLTLALATIVASGVGFANEKSFDLRRSETVTAEKLIIVPIRDEGLVAVNQVQPPKPKKELPRS